MVVHSFGLGCCSQISHLNQQEQGIMFSRHLLAFNSATSQRGHGTAVLAFHTEPGAIPESLSTNNTAAV